MNLICWNIRGVGGLVKSTAIRNLVLERNPALMALLETKHSIINSQRTKKWWTKDGFCWEDVPAINGGGGLILV